MTVRTGKVTETTIAYWDPTRKRGGRLVVIKRVYVYKDEPSRNRTGYAYRGDGTSGSIEASTDAEAIAYVERNVVPMQEGRLQRMPSASRDTRRARRRSEIATSAATPRSRRS